MNFKEFLDKEKISLFAAASLQKMKVIRPDKLERMCISKDGSVLLLIIPYNLRGGDKNISAYAVPRDYHLYFEDLSSRLSAVLSADFPGHRFIGAADNSPIDEVHAAMVSGLGLIGDNGLFITEKYGSYVFIGSIYSDLKAEEYRIPSPTGQRTECSHCGACAKACPASAIKDKSLCLSALTQKKGELTEREASLIKANGCAWGCDKCQEACPYNRSAEDTEIQFFKEDRISNLTVDILRSMTDEEFSKRAYSWRKRKTIERNLLIWEEKN